MYKVSLFLISLTLLVSAGCERDHHEVAEKPKLLVAHPLRTDTELTREYVAQIRAIQHIELRALERGYIQEIFVDEGQRIKKGEKMFQILPLLYQAEVQKAAAEAQLSEIEYNNTKILADKSVVSPNELAMANARVNTAKAHLSLAATHRSLTEIRAPFDGLMGRFNVRTGSLVDEGDLLTTMSDNSTMWVYFNVSESEYLKYKSQSAHGVLAPVKLIMANGELFNQPGKVETIESDFNSETGNIAFRATFSNPDGLLRHGETGNIVMSVPLKNALLIPQKATFDILDKKFVFVVDKKHVVHSRPITIAAEMPQIYAVAGGIGAQDLVLVEGLRKVHDGVKIQPDYQPSSTVLANLKVPAE
ncbi:MAG: efflux RND transporter periplasmic adaptor subunit [Myxococcales bacterium]|nr:efflux RND transporter periplasmic adaptor subunit [Myxococcales bacterium]MCB9708072.1 efflux RND transporter periplasmic adaptor subunit [Myxococcales bacterium]